MKTELSGIIEGFDNAAYHASEGVSFSGFKKFMSYPLKYKYWLETREEEEQTASQRLGTMAHMAILEPELFTKSYAVMPILPANCLSTMDDMKAVLKTADLKLIGKKDELVARIKEAGLPYIFKDDLLASLGDGCEVVSRKEYQKVIGMRDAVMNHPVASRLVTGGVSELSAYSKHPVYGLTRKCRPDHWISGKLIMSDLKSCTDASPVGAEMMLKKHKWGHQGAWYLDVMGEIVGQKLNQFVHIFVETEAPHAVGLYALDDETLERCRMDIEIHLKRLARCTETGVWPGLPTDIQAINLPYYAFTDAGEIE
jgi:hypothetical protein